MFFKGDGSHDRSFCCRLLNSSDAGLEHSRERARRRREPVDPRIPRRAALSAVEHVVAEVLHLQELRLGRPAGGRLRWASTTSPTMMWWSPCSTTEVTRHSTAPARRRGWGVRRPLGKLSAQLAVVDVGWPEEREGAIFWSLPSMLSANVFVVFTV